MGSRALESCLDGRSDPGEVALEEVVRGARLHAPDGGFLVDRAGYYEEGNARGPLPGKGESRHAVESGEGVVGEDHVRTELLQRMKESVTAVDSPGQERYAGTLQLVFHELGVHWHVFKD